MGGFVEFFVYALVSTAVSVGASVLLAPKPPKIKKPKPQPKEPDPKQPRQEDPGRAGNIRSAESPQAVVYGWTIKGGTLGYINGTGPDNLRLHQTLCLAGHECAAIGDVLLDSQIADENEVNPSSDADINIYINNLRGTAERELVTKYTSPVDLLRLTRHLGTADQAADPDLVTENANWTSEHRGRGICYLRTRYSYKAEVFQSFIPTTTCEVYGKKVYDPRSDTTEWSMNPALIAADILETILGIDRANIDTASLTAAANVCDETVTTKSVEATPRYTANGFFELDGNWEEYLTPVVNAMAGAIIEWGGTYYIKAGAWDSEHSDVTITDEDLMGPMSRQTADSDQRRSNGVKGTYISPATYDTRTEFPLYKDAVAIAEDGGVLNMMELQLDMVNDHRQAQRLARIALNESRLDEAITIETTLEKGLDVLPWDNVTFQSDILGVNDTYRVSNLRLVPGNADSPALVPELTLTKHNADVYDWNANTDEQDIQTAKTNLPGVGDGTKPTNATYSLALNTTHANQIAAVATVNWDDPVEDVVEIEIEITIEFEESAAGSGGPWTERTYTATTQIAEGVETAVINLGDNSAGPFDFQNHEITKAVIRSKLDDASFSGDVTLVAT